MSYLAHGPIVLHLIIQPMSLTTCRLPNPPAFEGVLEPNNILHKAERIFENELSGPESIVVDGGKKNFNFYKFVYNHTYCFAHLYSTAGQH